MKVWKRIRKYGKLFITFLLLGGLVGSGLFLADLVSEQDLSSEDSSAIFGGGLEYGYPSAGYVLSYSSATSATICGAVQLDSDLLITAAHCLNSTSDVFLNTDFLNSQQSLNQLSARFFKKNGWDGVNPENDLAAILYNAPDTYGDEFAKIGTPREGCGYRLVGYGRTKDDGEAIGTDRDKKSAAVCIENIDDDVIILKGDDGGICLGDSGSPVYEDGTNKVVGVISSVILQSRNEENPCYIGNRGIAVRTDTNIDFINAVAEDADIETELAQAIEVGAGAGENANISSPSRVGSAVDSPIPIEFNAGDEVNEIFGLPLQLVQTVYFLLVIGFVGFVVRVWLASPKGNDVEIEAIDYVNAYAQNNLSSVTQPQSNGQSTQASTTQVHNLGGTIDYYEPPTTS